jgi:hypothetical protein
MGPSSGAGVSPQYCNGVQVFTSSWDFNFEFYHVVPILGEQEGEPPTITRNVVQRTVMSPQHAKAFLEVLGQNVVAWEAQFGEIQTPPENPNQP